jgi:hypothetical protein
MWLAHRTNKKVGELRWCGGDIHIYKNQIEGCTSEAWSLLIADITPKIEYEKAEIQNAAMEEKKRIEEAAVKKAEGERIAREEEERKKQREEIESSKDSEKWEYFIKEINSIIIPSMNTWRYKKIAESATDLLKQIKFLKQPK